MNLPFYSPPLSLLRRSIMPLILYPASGAGWRWLHWRWVHIVRIQRISGYGSGFFTAFDPELKITVREGKVFDPLESRVQQVRALPEIDVWTETLEENAMV